MSKVVINPDLCKGCGMCVKECPSGCIVVENGKAHLNEEKKGGCINCGHCESICGNHAITLFGNVDEEALPKQPTTVIDAIRTRRTQRHYKGPIPKEELDKLISLTKYCPSGHNQRAVKFLVIDQPKLGNILKELAREYAKLENPIPFMLQFISAQEEVDMIGRGAPHMIIAYCDKGRESRETTVDATIALTSIELAAVNQGYGTLWAGLLTMLLDREELLPIVGLQGKVVCYCLAIGVPSHKFVNPVDRQEVEITHLE